MPRLALHWQILIALLCAVAVGLWNGLDGPLLPVFDFIGRLFMNGLKMLIVPLIIASIIAGMLHLSGTGDKDSNAFARLGSKTLIYYIGTSALAVATGLLVVNLLSPGLVDGDPGAEALGLQGVDASEIESKVAGRSSGDMIEIFLRMVPPNIVAAAADGQMLGLIFFSLLFGFFVTRLPNDQRETQTRFWDGMNGVMLGITSLIMRFAPIGVFGLVAAVVAKSPDFWGTLLQLGYFSLTVLLALGIHMFVTMPLILIFIARVSPIKHYAAMAPALMTAFSTASSSATLPVTIDAVQQRAGVSRETSGFVLPLGATINMDGTALYEVVVVLFIAQAYGLDLSVAQQLLVAVLALTTSIGVAGIPSASLVAITLILTSFGLPIEGIAVIWVFDRILDMCRTAVNVWGDSVGAVVVGKLEGENTILSDDFSSKAAAH